MWKPLTGVQSKPDTLPIQQNIVEDGPVVHGNDRCPCRCHRISGAIHVKPCCRVCPCCRQNIADGKYAEHLKHCALILGGKS